MAKMREGAWREFMIADPRTGKLAVVRPDGRPHVRPIWFDLDGDEIVFTTWHTTVKARAILRDDRVSVCVDDERPPFAFVAVDGVARIDDRPGERARWARRIAARYMGPELADRFGARNDVEGELLVRVQPTRITAEQGIAD
jgi:PPOX class probable F420-dependent enzyme